MNDIAEQNKIETETYAYKLFLRVAKKLKYLDYGKWSIVPDPSDPLRKFTVEKDTALARLKLVLTTHTYRKRNWSGDWGNSYGYRYSIGVKGLYHNSEKDLIVKTGLELKPRMARKLLECIDKVIVPKFYESINDEIQQQDTTRILDKTFKDNVAKLQGLVDLELDRYNPRSANATIRKSNLEYSRIKLTEKNVSMDLLLDYETAKKVIEVLHG